MTGYSTRFTRIHMNNNRYKFWMVFVTGAQAPIKQHFTRAAAESEAQRLAMKTGVPVYILESQTGYETPMPEIAIFPTDEVAPSVA